eukprot:gene7738-618_t
MQERLSAHGFCPEDVRHVNLVVSDMDMFNFVNAEYIKFFGINPPSRTCVEFVLPRNRHVQIDALCSRTYANELPPKHMHVQSVSHWAPANIGPYSQAVQVNNTVFLAGQIGLEPSTMELAKEPGIEAYLSLRHVTRVLQAHGLVPSHLIMCTCFLRDASLYPLCKQLLEDSIVQDRIDEEFSYFPHRNTTPASSLSSPPAVADALFCVVPNLPKHAMVEWHFCAVTCKTKSEHCITLPEDYISKVTITCSNELAFASTCINISEHTSPKSLTQIVVSTQQQTSDILKENHKGCLILMTRVFCLPDQSIAIETILESKEEDGFEQGSRSGLFVVLPVKKIIDGSLYMQMVAVL